MLNSNIVKVNGRTGKIIGWCGRDSSLGNIWRVFFNDSKDIVQYYENQIDFCGNSITQLLKKHEDTRRNIF